MPKIRAKKNLFEDQDANVEQVVNLYEYKDFVLLLTYEDGGTSTAKLQSSVDYDKDSQEGTWIDIPGSSETLGADDGAVEWRCENLAEPFVKVVVSGDATGCTLTFAGSNLAQR